jgi:phytoene dehydrogenase-like protein
MVQYDVTIVGGGHNGLVAAGYLASAGLRVLILEKNAKVGGLAITDEIFPGYKFNTFGHHFGYFLPKIYDDLGLAKYGLQVCPMPVGIRPFSSGRYFFESLTDPDATVNQIEKFSAHDAERYGDWMLMWLRAGSVFKNYLLSPPPSFAELAKSLEGTDEEYDFYRLLTTPQKILLDEYFESEDVKTALSNVIEGPPSSAMMNMYIASLIAVTADVQIRGLDGYLKGGMGSLTQALARSDEEKGVQIETGVTVDHVLISDAKANGVVLEDGKTITSKTVISNLDPKTTYLHLIGTEHLDRELVGRVNGLHSTAGYLRMHCAIDRIPKWKILPSHAGPGSISPSLEFMEKAWNDASYGRVPKEPIVAFRMPCLNDPTMAPSGKYGMEVWVQYAPVHPNLGSWDKIREDVGNQLIDFIDEWIIDFKKSLLKWRLYTPLDIERWANVSEGHMCHLDLTNDQMMSFRPLLGWTSYRTPIKGLYLCSSGTHGGGAVTGIPGHNAAQALLDDWKNNGRKS